MPVKSYRELQVWEKAVELAVETYRITRSLPIDERFGMTSQMRRAGVSVAANIAEGSVRSKKEFKHFISISRGSTKELEALSLIAIRLGYLDDQKIRSFLEAGDEVSRMLWSLGSRLR